MENVRRLLVVGKKLFIAGCVIKTFTLYGFDVWLLTEKSMEPTLTDGKYNAKTPYILLLLLGRKIFRPYIPRVQYSAPPAPTTTTSTMQRILYILLNSSDFRIALSALYYCNTMVFFSKIYKRPSSLQVM